MSAQPAPPLRIVADDREQAGGVVAVLESRADVVCEVVRLDVGDYRVEGRVIVERKTVPDLAASLVDGRLFPQVAALTARSERAVLIIEGNAGQARDSGVSRESLQGALITVGVFYGVAILRSIDAEETARLLIYLGCQTRRYAHGAWPRPGRRPKGRRARQLFLLQGLPGVGPERAERLLDTFGSVEAVMAAPAAALAAVDGLGAKTAERIRWAVEESAGGFGAT